MTYEEFVTTKATRHRPVGFDPAHLNRNLKPFQRALVEWSCRMGRSAIFAGTGLGKSIMQLSYADAVADNTEKPVLLLAPLAVSHQTVAEAAKFDIDGVSYAATDDGVARRILITNYERVENFDMSQFGAVVLDESSIIKAHDSKTRAQLTELCAGIDYRLCCTATPAPNDYRELGNHSEFLGILNEKEMLATWFVHDGSIRATSVHNKMSSKPIADWRLKGHAEADFWRWLATWSAVVRHPRDLGFEEDGYDLPPLNVEQITVQVEHTPSIDTGTLFPMEANTLQERRAAASSSVASRVKAAADIVASDPHDQWLVWCNLNTEADALRAAIPDAIEVRGADKPEDKTERLLGFADGKHRILISKPSIAGFGMNFQRCRNIVFVGLNDSFEQLYQAIRRCWRFGQSREVNVWMIAAETEGAVVANLRDKEAAADHMAGQMAEHMRELTRNAVRGHSPMTYVPHTQPMQVPQWM
jgi:hypothetical protein